MYWLHWDHAAVVGPDADGAEANALLGLHAYADDDILNLDDANSDLILTDGTRVVAEIMLPGPGFDFGASSNLDWQPFAFTRANATFTVHRTGRVAILRAPGG